METFSRIIRASVTTLAPFEAVQPPCDPECDPSDTALNHDLAWQGHRCARRRDYAQSNLMMMLRKRKLPEKAITNATKKAGRHRLTG
jgi:hypothetical protein